MPNWTVWIFAKESGKAPFEKWRDSKKLTGKDRAALDAKVLTVEAHLGPRLPPETLKEYQTTNLKEFKVKGDKKQLRPLCIVDEEKCVIILCGAIEKDGSIPSGDIETAENLRKDYLGGGGAIKRYFEDQDDLEEDGEQGIP